MRGFRSWAGNWLPVVAVMVLIFLGSTEVLSSDHTSRVLAPLLRWLCPGISQTTLDQVHAVVRKTGHLTEYALLAALIWRGLRRPVKRDTRPWSWREATWALSLTVAYAVTDEIHQWFVATRYGSARDVLIDACGAGAGLFLVWLVGYWRKRW